MFFSYFTLLFVNYFGLVHSEAEREMTEIGFVAGNKPNHFFCVTKKWSIHQNWQARQATGKNQKDYR